MTFSLIPHAGHTHRPMVGFLLCLLSTSAIADDIKHWGDVGDWSVYIDTSAGNGCFIERIEDETIKFRLGYLPVDAGAFISVASTEWNDIPPEAVQKVRLLFDGVMYVGDAQTFSEDGFVGGVSFFNNPDFLTDFTKRQVMTIVDPEGEKEDVDLTGTGKAVAAMQKCQEAQGL